MSYHKIFSHIGACTCAQEPKTCARGRFCILKRILEIGHGKTKYSLTIYLTTKKIQQHRNMHMCTGAKNVRARPFSRACGCLHIVTCIVDIMHGKTKYSMTIYLTTTKIQPHGACMCVLFSLSHGLEICHKRKNTH